jgi:hypothetical protein
MHCRSMCFIGVFVLLLTPLSMPAQTPAAMTKGRTSLAIDLPFSGGRVSIWRFVSGRTNLGAVLGFNATSENDDYDTRTISVDVGPSIKHYFSPRARVAPFVRADAAFGFQHQSVENVPIGPDYNRTSYSARVGTGLGVDWFATDDISIGAHTGLFAGWLQYDESDRSVWFVSMSSSALTMHIYF